MGNKPTTEQFLIYMNFVVYFIVGKVGNAMQIFDDHRDAILVTSRFLMKKVNILPIYRGVILKDSDVEEVAPDKIRKFISFSGDINVAKNFGDPCPQRGFGFGPFGIGAPEWASGSFFGHGYEIEYKPKREELLFHYSLLFDKKLVGAFIDLFSNIGSNTDGKRQLETFRRQKEVLLLNMGQTYKLKPLKVTVEYEGYAYGELEKQGWVVERDMKTGKVSVYRPDDEDED